MSSGLSLARFALTLTLIVPVASPLAGSISGKVTDGNGAILSGAQVAVTQSESSVSERVFSDGEGYYMLESLAPGIYTLSVSKTGYVAKVVENVALNSEESAAELNFQLESGPQVTEVRGVEELNPNVFVVKLDTNEIQRRLVRRGADIQPVGEFRAQQNYYGTTYGHPLREVEFVQTRSRLEDFHFSVYENHQNSALNARSFFTKGDLKPSRRNEYGATAAVPLTQKMSLNVAWSGLRDSGFVNGNIQVPKEDERTPRSEDPATNALIAGLLRGYPDELPNLPDVGDRHLNTNALREIRTGAFSVRFDYDWRPSDQIAVQQRFLDYTEEPFELVAGQNPETLSRAQSVHLTHTHTFSPGTISRLSYNFDRLAATLDVTERYRNLLEPLGIEVVPDIGVSGEWRSLGPGSPFPRRRVENRFHFSPELTHTWGSHNLTAGFNLTRFQINDLQSDQSRGGFSFTRDDFGEGVEPKPSAVDNFLLGRPTSFGITIGNLYRGFRNWEHAFWVQDTIGLRPDLTLSLGLRYEIMTTPREVNDLTTMPYGTDANNFAPRVGFAWSPGGGRTVLRGGYGTAFGTVFPLLYQRARFNPPAVQILLIAAPDLVDPLGGAAEIDKSELKLISPDMVAPYTHIYTLQLQRELPAGTILTVAYVGNRTIKLPNRVVSNRAEPVPGIETTTATINQRRPNPDFLQITTSVNGTMAYLDALQVALSKRLSRGLSWDVRYTFSKAISTGATTFADIDTGDVSQSNELVRDMKAVTNFDTPHALTFSYRYQFPWLRGSRGLKSLLLGEWQVLGTTTLRSGTPTSVYIGSDSLGNVDGVNQPDRPNLLNTAILATSFDHPDTAPLLLTRDHFDTERKPPDNTWIPAGGRGDLGLNTFRIDGTHNWNLALSKDFSVSGLGRREPRLRFRAEFINAFNQPQFDDVNNRISSENFGRILNTANKGRVVQLSLRFSM